MLKGVFTIYVTLAIFAVGLAIEPVGMVVTARGISQVTDSQGQKHRVKMGMAVYVGDCIETDRQATIKILFVDETTLSLAGDSEVVIDEYQYGQGKTPRATTHIKNGVFRFMAGKMAKEAPENFKVETATATIGIRGSGGYGWTSDGTRGRAGLKIATVAGHVLEVTTLSGQTYLIDEPSVGLIVDENGKGVPWIVEKALEPVAKKSQPFPMTVPQSSDEVWFPFSRTYLALRRRKRVFNKIFRGDPMMDREDKLREQIPCRDLSLEPERASSRLMMEKLARQENPKKREKPKVREVSARAEASSSQGILRRLGVEQMKALNEQFSKVTKQNG